MSCIIIWLLNQYSLCTITRHFKSDIFKAIMLVFTLSMKCKKGWFMTEYYYSFNNYTIIVLISICVINIFMLIVIISQMHQTLKQCQLLFSNYLSSTAALHRVRFSLHLVDQHPHSGTEPVPRWLSSSVIKKSTRLLITYY